LKTYTINPGSPFDLFATFDKTFTNTLAEEANDPNYCGPLLYYLTYFHPTNGHTWTLPSFITFDSTLAID